MAVPFDELSVVESCNNRLARPGCGDNKIPVSIVPLAFDRERVEHPLLMWVWPHLEVGERNRRGLAE